MASVSSRKERLKAKLIRASSEHAELSDQLQQVKSALRTCLKEREKHDSLKLVIAHLDHLSSLGGDQLFWGDARSAEDIQSWLMQCRKRVEDYEGEVEALQSRYADVWRKVSIIGDKIEDYRHAIKELKEREIQALDDFVVEREVDGIAYHAMVMPWTVNGEDEKRFRKILLLVLFLAFLLGYLIPLWQLPVVKEEAKIEVPERLAKLLLEKKPPPPPPPPKEEEPAEEKPEEEKPKEEKKEEVEKKPEPVEKPKPQKEETKVARKKAESSGVLAFKSDFAGLLDLNSEVDTKLGAEARLTNKGATARKSSRSIITSQATSGTAGINTAAISRNVGGTGNMIEGVGVSSVESSIGTEYATEDRPLSEGPGPSRTDEEIQIVFDKYKSALYRIYNRELRKNPTLQGKMVLKLTIEPSGEVSACTVDSSDMDSPEMNEKIVARVKRFNFGAKEGVPTITILFPVDFLPAS